MTRSIEISYKERVSRFVLRLVDRKSLHGFKRRIALDERGVECTQALLTCDGGFLLPAGSTAESYLDPSGDVVKRSELVAVDVEGKPLTTLPATSGRPQRVGPIGLDDFLGHVMTRVYALEGETLDASLDMALRSGAIFRLSFRPRATSSETPAFLLANDAGIFLVQAQACHFDFVGLTQAVFDAETQDESDADFNEDDEFSFELDWEADHAGP